MSRSYNEALLARKFNDFFLHAEYIDVVTGIR